MKIKLIIIFNTKLKNELKNKLPKDITLLQKYQTLDNVYQNLDADSLTDARPNVIKKLTAGRESAYISQKLAKIDQNIELDFNLKACAVDGYNKDAMAQLLTRYGFHSCSITTRSRAFSCCRMA